MAQKINFSWRFTEYRATEVFSEWKGFGIHCSIG